MNNIDLYIIKYFNNNFKAIDEATIFDNFANEIKSSMKIDNIDYNTDDIISRLKIIRKFRKTLKELKKIPHIKQRTPEWFDARKSRLTASDLYDAIKGNSTSLVLAKKKANVIIDNTNFNAIPALKWGTMFEAMADRCYSKKYGNISVNEFGLLCDKYNKHFAASPDGISDIGIMVEIKCPYSRKIIDGFIPPKYQLQMQGQLAVCELEECDYIECEFKTYNSEEEFKENITENSDDIFGIIAEYNIKLESGKSEYKYLYSNDLNTYDDVFENIQKKVALESLKTPKLVYWKLISMNIQRVNFNKNKWEETLPKIDEFWKKVEDSRGLPVENKTPKKFAFIEDD